MNPRITKYGEARHILKLQDHAIHKMKNVNYTGVRFEDGQWKLHIGVTKRLPEHDKLLNPVINFSGLPLIFDEIGEIKALAANRTIKYRPAPPGVSIGHYAITAGTLGVTCFKDGTKHILSNNHVLANENSAVIGNAILQPGAVDGGANPTDKIGTLAAFVPLVFNNANNPNYVDCALALPLDVNDLLGEILELGYSTGSKEAEIGMNVVKSGRTTGITTGTITEFSGIIAIGYDAGTAYFDDQIITGPMLQGGDSGSCLLDSLDNKAVGLCFAGSDTMGIANRMTEVVAALGITIFQPTFAIGTTQAATIDSVAGTITLNGYVAYVHGSNPHRYFEWGASSKNYTFTEDCGVAGVGAFSATISIDPDTYYCVAKIVDGAETNYGREMAAILPPPPPTVTTQDAATDPAVGTITLNGNVVHFYGGTPHRYFEWGTVSGTYDHTEDCGIGGVGSFSKVIFLCGGTYYYRAKAIDNTSVGYGAEIMVTRAFSLMPPVWLFAYKDYAHNNFNVAWSWRNPSPGVGIASDAGGIVISIDGAAGQQSYVTADRGQVLHADTLSGQDGAWWAWAGDTNYHLVSWTAGSYGDTSWPAGSFWTKLLDWGEWVFAPQYIRPPAIPVTPFTRSFPWVGRFQLIHILPA